MKWHIVYTGVVEVMYKHIPQRVTTWELKSQGNYLETRSKESQAVPTTNPIQSG